MSSTSDGKREFYRGFVGSMVHDLLDDLVTHELAVGQRMVFPTTSPSAVSEAGCSIF